MADTACKHYLSLRTSNNSMCVSRWQMCCREPCTLASPHDVCQRATIGYSECLSWPWQCLKPRLQYARTIGREERSICCALESVCGRRRPCGCTERGEGSHQRHCCSSPAQHGELCRRCSVRPVRLLVLGHARLRPRVPVGAQPSLRHLLTAARRCWSARRSRNVLRDQTPHPDAAVLQVADTEVSTLQRSHTCSDGGEHMCLENPKGLSSDSRSIGQIQISKVGRTVAGSRLAPAQLCRASAQARMGIDH